MLTIALATLAIAVTQEPRVLDDFERLAAWSAHPSEGVSVTLHSAAGVRGRAMRMDFDFHGGSGYALIRRRLDVDLPANYAFAFFLRADSPDNNLEFKLIDSTGDNVWWSNQRDVEFPRRWSKITRRKRHIGFAWGPAGGGELRHVAALEIAVTAGRGGKGTIWLDELSFAPLPPDAPYDLTPSVVASAATPGHPAAYAVDRDSSTFWESTARAPTLTLDFLRSRELGGLAIDWAPGAFAADYVVELSDDGVRWTTAYDVTGGNGGRDYVFLPETETRYLRIRSRRRDGTLPVSIRDIAIQTVEWTATRNAFFRSISRDEPRGSYPRYFDDQMVYWTVVGASGGTRQALLSEDGAVEPFAFEWSLEPFLRVGDTLVTWADVSRRQSLENGSLPVPTVEWERPGITLSVTAFTLPRPGGFPLNVRYRVLNTTDQPRDVTLYVALRPFQVNTPWQFLNGTGGVGRIHSLAFDGKSVSVRAADTTRVIRLITPPAGFGAATFDNGVITDILRAGRVPAATRVSDARGFASGVLAYALALPARGMLDVRIAIPFHGVHQADPGLGPTADYLASPVFHATVGDWERTLGDSTGTSITLPASARRITETLRSSLAYMLIERSGPALRPGTRAYARSWIRDGALMSAGLSRLGHTDEVRHFIDWFLPFQRPDGRVPCCVDARGADPVAEHDSHGELIYLVAEYWRMTRDSAYVARVWPHVALAVAYIDSLRRTHMTAEYASDSGRVFYGLLPPSISHEGYSAKPMHSYWDDFFALKGLSDAGNLAEMLGRADDARRIGAIRDEFRRDLLRSIALSMARHHIDYIPGSADLGDFDATSTTIAIAPGDELRNLPDSAVRRTFERYYENTRARRDGRLDWNDYTPYELRAVGTFVRLGWKDRAHELLDFFFDGQRPAAWRQWAEVVGRDSLAPRFIGDMPHAWVASDYVRSILDFFAYERADDRTLVLGAGIPEAWVRDDGGVTVRRLRTYYGTLGFRMRARGDTVVVQFDAGLTAPPGGIVVRSPINRPLRSARADGQPVDAAPDQVVLRRPPRELVFVY